MKRYFRIYRTFLGLNYARTMAYRADLLNGILASLFWAGFSVIAIYALTAKSPSVFGWTREEIFVLIGVFNIMVGGTFRMLFAKNFDQLTHIIERGELDGVLLKPIDSQFFVSFQYCSLYNGARVIFACIFTAFMLHLANVPFSILALGEFLVLAILGLIILYAVWYIVLTLLIWFPDLYNLAESLYTIDQITRFPPQILNELRFLFLFFPLTLVVSIPAKALLQKLTVFDTILIIITAVIMLFVTRTFWKFALRFYTSASG